MKEQSVISVYLDNGTVYSYTCDSYKAREHTYAIANTGYRTVDDDGVLTHYPVHRISKVKADNQSTRYQDIIRGT